MRSRRRPPRSRRPERRGSRRSHPHSSRVASLALVRCTGSPRASIAWARLLPTRPRPTITIGASGVGVGTSSRSSSRIGDTRRAVLSERAISGPRRLFRSRPAEIIRGPPGSLVGCRNYHRVVPVHEFACRECGHRFEELTGSHVGREQGAVLCPECGAKDPERLISSPSPAQRGLTPNQRRRLEDKRGTNRGGAMERFRKQRAAERRTGGGRGR